MTQNDHSDVYIIPPNFVRDGTLFSGRAEARNVVEAAFLALVGIRFLVFLNLGIKGKIYVGIILILPLVILAVIGVQGESLSSFLIQLFSYMVKRRVLTAPSGQYRLKRNRRIRKQQKKRCSLEFLFESAQLPGCLIPDFHRPIPVHNVRQNNNRI